MKERVGSVHKDRTYDADGYTQRSGCLCFKTESEKEVTVMFKSYILPNISSIFSITFDFPFFLCCAMSIKVFKLH